MTSIRPARLATVSASALMAPGSAAVVIGRGYTSPEQPAVTDPAATMPAGLLGVSLPIVSGSLCLGIFGGGQFDSALQLCAGAWIGGVRPSCLSLCVSAPKIPIPAAYLAGFAVANHHPCAAADSLPIRAGGTTVSGGGRQRPRAALLSPRTTMTTARSCCAALLLFLPSLHHHLLA